MSGACACENETNTAELANQEIEQSSFTSVQFNCAQVLDADDCVQNVDKNMKPISKTHKKHKKEARQMQIFSVLHEEEIEASNAGET